MNKRLLIPLFVILIGLSISSPVLAQSGFVPKQIWYSKEKLIEGETVDIHTSVWNGEQDTVLLKIGFYDEEIILGSREVIVKPSELKDVFITWKVTAGEHIISARIISSVVIVGEDKKDVSLRYIKTEEDKQEVEKTKKVVEKKETNNDTNLITGDILPENISSSINQGYGTVDNFRSRTSEKLLVAKDNVKEEVKEIKEEEGRNKDTQDKNKKVDDMIKKPFAYLKLFVVSVLSFIFENKLVFYGLIILVVFYLVRLAYRSIKHK